MLSSTPQGFRQIAPRLVLLLAMAAIAALGAAMLPLQRWMELSADWAAGHPLEGRMLLLVASILGSVLMIPGSVLIMSGGFLYGLIHGSVIMSVGSVAGATAAFLVGRRLARPWAEARLRAYPRVAALDSALARRGLLVVALTRLSLLFPYNVLNYAYGVSGVGLRSYFLGTWLGMLPAVVLYVYMGAQARSFAGTLTANAAAGGSHQTVAWIGGVTALVVIFVLHRAASRILQRELTGR